MVSINRVEKIICTGNTYGNLERLRKIGARFDNGSKVWTLAIQTHPLNNTKQKKKLEAMLNEMEENGVRFVAWFVDGTVSK